MPTHFPRCVSPLNKKSLIYSAVKVMYAHNADRNILCVCRERKKVVDCEESVCVCFFNACISEETRTVDTPREDEPSRLRRKEKWEESLRYVSLWSFCTFFVIAWLNLWQEQSLQTGGFGATARRVSYLRQTEWAAESNWAKPDGLLRRGFSVLEIVKRHGDVGQSVGFEPDNAGTMGARLVSGSPAWWK